ncbi:related to neutral amino acid permease [Ramularia collo-cygni]|uniref:Related to neutral amino acid permease n=1 Tax=Ramularia collo-cygni TaxID=112498 RepID=A0A2D3UN39_9PEZI|nr:related to neutral amino acid permease [Ramularia collo-cygni]CZT17242.1 related to neutral amino acid permease [Ramularia collo-cygni]
MSSPTHSTAEQEKISTYNEKQSQYNASSDPEILVGEMKDVDDDREVFRKGADVDFRTVSWQRASVIFLKLIFATGVLSIPTAMLSLGAVGGAFNVIGWGALNTYSAVIQGDFRNRHSGCHSIADMAFEVGGTWLKETVGFLFVVAYVLCTGSGILGVSVGLNALSHHAACTVWWAFLATLVVAVAASVRKFQQMSWLTWAGFLSIFIAVFIVVVAVTTLDRPAAAPQTGDFDLGFYAIPAGVTFAAGVVASTTIFVSSAATSAFLPVISEMRNPRDFRKALYVCMGIVTAAYLSLSLVVYRWAGKWVASPSLGSAGQTVKMVAYGIGLVGLIVSACLYLHVAAKYCFVRILRDSRHLQSNTFIHWATWLGLTFGGAFLAFILAEAIPIFNYLIALTGSVCFAPIAISLPGYLWLFDHKQYRTGNMQQQTLYWLHAVMIPLGAFICVGGTYGVIEEIIKAYANGQIGSAFSCADNSGST